MRAFAHGVLYGIPVLLFAFLFVITAPSAIAATTKIGMSFTSTSSSIGLNQGLVGYWTFDGNDVNWGTGRVLDRSGKGNNGTMQNMSMTTSPVPGKIGQGMKFNGTDQRMTVTQSPSLNTMATVSVSAWVKVSNAAANGIIVRKNTNTPTLNNNLYQLDFNAGSFRFSAAANGSGVKTTTGSISITNNKWYHVVGVYDGAMVHLYVNGVADGVPATLSGTINTGASMNLGIGVDDEDSSAFFPGTLDDVRIYNRILSAADIKQLAGVGKVTLLPGGGRKAVIAPTFTCGFSSVKDADGNAYTTLKIGTQCWMKQNMRVGTRINGATNQTNNGIIEKYCYSDTATNCTANDPNQPDGGLYQWDEAMQYSTAEKARGICPAGWHIPSHDEFTTLERAICTSGTCATDFPYDTTTQGQRGTNEGTKLKPNGTSKLEWNITGYSYGVYGNRGVTGYAWSSTQNGSLAWRRYVVSGQGYVYRDLNMKAVGYPVRCLKDS